MIDTAIVGQWTNGGQGINSFLRNGSIFLIDSPLPYSQPDPTSLILVPPAGPETFQRMGGTGPGLVELWTQTHNERTGPAVEEMILRADGSYTVHWTVNGTPSTEHFGLWTNLGTELLREERRGQCWTGPGNQMVQSYFWGSLMVGVYSVAVDGTSWVFHSSQGDITYTRAERSL